MHPVTNGLRVENLMQATIVLTGILKKIKTKPPSILFPSLKKKLFSISLTRNFMSG